MKLHYYGYVSNFLRKRLMFWDTSEPIGKVTDRTIRYISLAGKLTKPAVQFAYMRTCMNGWPTFQRMHHCSSFTGSNICVFGCGNGSDSLKHYGHCNIIKAAFVKLFPDKEWRPGMEHRLCLCNTTSEKDLQDNVRFIYAMYRTFNLTRHSCTDDLDIVKVLMEFFKQSRWKRS